MSKNSKSSHCEKEGNLAYWMRKGCKGWKMGTFEGDKLPFILDYINRLKLFDKNQEIESC